MPEIPVGAGLSDEQIEATLKPFLSMDSGADYLQGRVVADAATAQAVRVTREECRAACQDLINKCGESTRGEAIEAVAGLVDAAKAAVLRGENLNCEVMRDTNLGRVGFHGKYAETQKDINRLARVFWASLADYNDWVNK